MTTQPNLPNMPSSPAGLMHEQTFNEALAAALRQRRKAGRDDERFIIAERQQVFDDASRERPVPEIRRKIQFVEELGQRVQ